ncbi:MAG: coproporphyrinogen dehydrogenase HemZ [Oscillospiraceae bacterium]|nr:coproporphyrinogen dehydrogenase HemZ [Oscillospiraceae bacterium]
MILFLLGHTYKYECEKVCRIFFPTEKIIFADGLSSSLPEDGKRVITEISKRGSFTDYICKAEINGKFSCHTVTEKSDKKGVIEENSLAAAMIKSLSEITGAVPPWGILTGVRPSKLMRKLIASGGEKEAKEIFSSELMVSDKKTQLAFDVAMAENEAIALSKPDSFSLYIAIPFCPTRCSYCSFVSHSVAQAKKLIPEYVKLLCEEIKQTSAYAKSLSLKLETVYFGGGTPTSLSADDIKKLLNAVNESFDAANCREFTVEAGRPDTIDEEKLRVLKNAGVGRISINPQTFSDEVLLNIGRRHKSCETEEKFLLARSLGFNNINMDFIAGLTGDTLQGFKNSIERALVLSPENITVHTLALKRASRMSAENEQTESALLTADMVEYSNSALSKSGYMPYYMYRQSKSLGNLENVGWTLPGRDCLYNIYMMEETHTVLSCGAGAVTKLKEPNGENIERIYNFKYPYEYISRFSELTDRKKYIEEFYLKGKTDGKR